METHAATQSVPTVQLRWYTVGATEKENLQPRLLLLSTNLSVCRDRRDR